jgi:hypothetical protein
MNLPLTASVVLNVLIISSTSTDFFAQPIGNQTGGKASSTTPSTADAFIVPVVNSSSTNAEDIPITADDMDYDAFPISFNKPRIYDSPQDWNALKQAKQAALLDPAVATAMQKFKESLQAADQIMRATLSKDPASKRLLDLNSGLELVTDLNRNAGPAEPPLGFGYRVEQPPTAENGANGNVPKKPFEMTPEEHMKQGNEATALFQARDQALKDPVVATAILKAREAYHQANVILAATLGRDPAIKALLTKYPYLKLARNDLGFQLGMRMGLPKG